MWYLTKDSILIHQTYRIALTWHHFVEFMKKYTVEIHSLCCALLWKFTQNWCWPRVVTRLQRVLVEFAKQFPLDSVDICFSGSRNCCCNVILFTFYPRLFQAIGVLLLPASVCLSVCLCPSFYPQVVCAITCHMYVLESPNLVYKCKKTLLRSL